MFKLLNFFKENLSYLIGIYILIQLIYILFFPVEYRSDSYYYYRLAQECINHNSFYPAQIHLYEDYIAAPLYVNLLIIVLRIFNSTFSIGVLNIVLNLFQLFLLYKISVIIFNERAARIAAVLYIFYLNTLGLIITNYNELLFGVLIFASIYFYLKKTKYSSILSGIFAAASIGVRPLGWGLLAAYVLICLYDIYKKTKVHKEFFQIVFSLAFFILVYGFFNLQHFGKFIYTSTTGPVNLLIGANDEATGSYNETVFEENNPGYISESEKKSYIEKGEIWETKALDWIKSHPIKWISLTPVKVGFMFLWDDFAISPLMNLQDWDLYHLAKHAKLHKSFAGLMPQSTVFEKIAYLTLQFIHYMYYISLLILIIRGIILLKKNESLNSNNYVLILFSLIGVLITLTTYGIPRYKYPFLIAMLPFAAVFLNELILKNKNNGIEEDKKTAGTDLR
jgi:hypothetical protein